MKKEMKISLDKSLRIFYCLLLFLIYSNHTFANQMVYIYAGPGVSKNSLMQTEKTLNFFLKPPYLIKRIFPEQIINEEWEKETALLIIPGGADLPYAKALNGAGNQKIKSYVENGGAFLGICAGSYYGGAFVDFGKNTDLEVQGERELSFFPGTVRGPILAPYAYRSESGARAAQISWMCSSDFQKSTLLSVYYNGGGYFVDAEKKNRVTVLASYGLEDYAAIIECEVGLGKAILSGVHFEYDPELLDSENDHLKPIIAQLRSQNQERLELVRCLLERVL